jgi:dTDP-glucose 4,6-dehydratase
MQRVLVTGGAGFIGHHVCEHLLRTSDAHVTVLDRLTYASTWNRLREIGAYENPRVTCIAGSFSDPIVGGLADEIGPQDVVLHLGAETHVDHSIEFPVRFINANVTGTLHVAQFAQRLGARMFLFGTDEVFGPAGPGVAYREDDRHRPGNPYAASKSGAEAIMHAVGNTFGVRYVITRTMNAIGERQHREKFIPHVIGCVLAGTEVQIHADPSRTQAGSRFYIHARNIASALAHLLAMPEDQVNGQAWHIVGEREVDNLELAQRIAAIIGRPLRFRLVDFHSSRPGHDLRYALDGSKLAAAGWAPPVGFDESLERVVRWTVDHPAWL